MPGHLAIKSLPVDKVAGLWQVERDLPSCVSSGVAQSPNAVCAAHGRSMQQERAIVVHPLFLHTLPKDTPRPPQQWDSLPAAILHRLASALTSAQDLATFEVLNRSCWIAAQDDQLWKRLCYQKFSPPRSAPCKNWKALYRFNHSLLHQVISQTKQTKLPFFMPSQGSICINVPVFA